MLKLSDDCAIYQTLEDIEVRILKINTTYQTRSLLQVKVCTCWDRRWWRPSRHAPRNS